MRLALTTVTRNRKGKSVRVTRVLDGTSFALGRGAQCTIHLPDPRVALEHATVYVSDGIVRLGVVGAATMLVNGRPDPEIRVIPGSAVEIGPYRIDVETPPDGADVALAIELVRPLPDDLAEIKTRSRMSLAATGLSKRRPAWVLAFIVLLLFLAFPVVNALMPALRESMVKHQVTPDASWNPGPLASGHAGFGHDCATCHVLPFQRVRDGTCLQCHDKIPGHVMPVSLQADLFDGKRCATCHAEHKGPDGLVRRDSGMCADCHQDLKRRVPGTKIADVGDFATAHPEFRLPLAAMSGTGTVRVAQSDKARLVEHSHLKFPHDVHLKAGLRAPKGRVTLDCKNCHVADASARTFIPVNMNQHCLECHTLEFEPAVTNRQVPHGNVKDVMATMQEFYANLALKDVAVDVIDTGDIRRGIPGGGSGGGAISDDQRKRALAWANSKGAVVAQDLFEKRVCIVCHEVSKTIGPGNAPDNIVWNIAPPRVPSSWMPMARFDHEKHQTFKCADCHESTVKSKSSDDIAIPDIASCRLCHTGSTPATNKVVSTCVSCHGFHEAGHPPWNQRAALPIGSAVPASASVPRSTTQRAQ